MPTDRNVVAVSDEPSLVFQRMLLVVLTAWALANIMPGFYRVVQPLASFGLSIDNDGLVIDNVTPFQSELESPSAKAGVVRGDRVDLRAMRCVPMSSTACYDILALIGGLGGLHYVLPGSRLKISFLARGDMPARTLTIDAARPPWNGLESLVLLADTLVGVAVVLTASVLVWQRPIAMTWGFFLFVIWFNPGQSYTFYALITAWPLAVLVQEVAEATAQTAALIGLIVFALRFPHNSMEPGWRPLERALPAIAAGFFALNLLTFANVFGFGTETLTRISYYVSFALNALVLLILIRRRRLLSPQDDQRMLWVIAGCAIGLPAFIIAELAQSAGLFQDVFGISEPPQIIIGLLYLLYGVLAWFVSEAIRRPRVISVTVPLRHGTVMAVLTLLIAVPIFYLHEWLAHNKDIVPLPEWAWLLIVGPLIIFVLHQLHEGAVHAADHLFSRRYHRAQYCLKYTGDALRSAQSADEIDRYLIAGPCELLSLASGAVFRRFDGAFRRCASTAGWQDADVKELDVERPSLAVPVRGGSGASLAIALYGPHQVGTDLDADECTMLGSLADCAGAAYERVEIEALRHEVAELRSRLAAAATTQ
ncbi:hypothetical protein [Beijerinckia indica]|uniref:hypothetical protein n=1 Tax=Beijerinckia indica TaxID=533 RepID=UPI0011D16BAA|nr:hypothetical protein [Beijerinckia indica]